MNFLKTYWYETLLVSSGAIALYYAILITVEKFALAVDSTHIPDCNVNPFISCGTVMQTPQAEVFGFPNPILGLIGFSIVITIGFALFAKARFDKWFWKAMQIGLSLALAFVLWLFYQSVFVIGALCPYCMVVWAMTIFLFSFTLFRAHKEEALLFSPLAQFFDRYGLKASHTIATIIFLIIIGAITYQFWFFWSGYLF